MSGSSTKTFVCIIEDVFESAGRGCVITPGIPKDAKFNIKIGDPISLKLEDGSEIRTTVRGIEIGGGLSQPGIPLLLPADMSKEQIPIGTELWTL